ncbi:hypothetical protein PA598K_00386 [Paenibacillus sp. 598K]|uniref:hypothetical protein n=1 Tax=Paenibacillus sp. 598K TaxID=1117987 RepID=UPI000FF9AD1F|nr:hypothetical protein [Paenibacillus sp. 598K]GBF72149.1 hypothetical protein PA598K_00386 [Paenibacillus sp. 598K]
MNLYEFLESRIGSQIEAFLPNQFVEGILVAAGPGFCTIDAENPSYIEPIERLTLLLDNATYFRLPAA